MQKKRKAMPKWRIVMDIVMYCLSAISLGLSVASFVISLAKEK